MAVPTFHLSPSQVTSGGLINVHVDTAPCNPATITFFANGMQVGSPQTCAPGSAKQFTCPANTSGRPWKVVVECPSDGDEKTGTIA